MHRLDNTSIKLASQHRSWQIWVILSPAPVSASRAHASLEHSAMPPDFRLGLLRLRGPLPIRRASLRSSRVTLASFATRLGFPHPHCAQQPHFATPAACRCRLLAPRAITMTIRRGAQRALVALHVPHGVFFPAHFEVSTISVLMFWHQILLSGWRDRATCMSSTLFPAMQIRQADSFGPYTWLFFFFSRAYPARLFLQRKLHERGERVFAGLLLQHHWSQCLDALSVGPGNFEATISSG